LTKLQLYIIYTVSHTKLDYAGKLYRFWDMADYWWNFRHRRL